MSPHFYTALLAFAATSAAAFELTSPSSSDYWVACENNTLSWTSNSTDPSQFSVALIDTSNTPSTPSLVNGNYQIANTLQASAGSAIIELNCISPSSSYQILFVNSSQYELEHPQVYLAGGLFEVQPNGTTPTSATSGLTTSVLAGSSPTGFTAANPAKSRPTTTTTSASSSNEKTGDASARASVGLMATLLAVGLAATAVLA